MHVCLCFGHKLPAQRCPLCLCSGGCLIARAVVGVFVEDENHGLWSCDDEFSVIISPSSESTVDRRGMK